MRARWLVSLLVLSVAAMSAAAVAAAPAKAPAAAERPGGRVCEALACTAAQRQELGAILMEFRADNRGTREALRKLERELAAELAKDVPSDGALDRIAEAMAKRHAELTGRVVDALVEVHAVLDAGQRAKLAAMIDEHGLRKLLGGRGDEAAPGRARAAE